MTEMLDMLADLRARQRGREARDVGLLWFAVGMAITAFALIGLALAWVFLPSGV